MRLSVRHNPAWSAFYPLLLSSALATALVVVRVWASHNLSYVFLFWNLVLAWVPYVCSLWAASLDTRVGRRWWYLLLPAAVWLAFLPNAPYLVTDFIHLSDSPPVPLWYDSVLLMSFAWNGCVLAIASLQTMQQIVVQRVGSAAGWLLVGSSALLSGYGVALGRFERWNSWDLLLTPRAILADILGHLRSPLDAPHTLTITLLFTALLLVCYMTVLSIGQFGRDRE